MEKAIFKTSGTSKKKDHWNSLKTILCKNMNHETESLNTVNIRTVWATARLLVTWFQPYLPNGWVLLQGDINVGSVQNFILLFCVWCESRELGRKGSSRFSCVTPVVEISEWVANSLNPYQFLLGLQLE